ncbi:MurR/RpiR family transcriptional regulator [Microbacterium esteraromaticum]|uniref:MurR/RpiR family transcriptional regulator n=2 Tax=Microbacterium esteraromaticum TaxID=57043 RepID=A0A7D8A8L6_9MICO|nr:MurR/RpiR family transcriptional regulator [Microbacterium esteraromaticum]
MAAPTPPSGSHQEHMSLSSAGERYRARLQQRSLSSVLQQRVVDKEKETLSVALDRVLEDNSAIALAGIVVAARRRFVAGTGKSFAYATLLARDLSGGLAEVFLVDNNIIRSVEVLRETKPTDVLVVFSFRRYRRDTIELAEQFVAAGGTVVAITDAEDSPITAVAASSIVVPTDSVSYADSPTAIAAIIHLVATLSTASAKGAKRRLAERDRISNELGIYLQD